MEALKNQRSPHDPQKSSIFYSGRSVGAGETISRIHGSTVDITCTRPSSTQVANIVSYANLKVNYLRDKCGEKLILMITERKKR
jgi:hypothetical protein